MTVGTTAQAVEYVWPEGDLRGLPTVFDPEGHRLGDGTFVQRIERDRLVVDSRVSYSDGRKTAERAVFRLKPRFAQEQWSFVERRGARVTRKFEIDLTTGKASWRKIKADGKETHGEDTVKDATKANAFAGLGLSFAAKNLMKQLDSGEKLTLYAIAFTPKPRAVEVELTSDAAEMLATGNRSVKTTRVKIHPSVPAIAKLFVKAPDSLLWFSRGSPPQLLRSQSTIAEPDDPAIVINLFGTGGAIKRGADDAKAH